MYRKGLVLLGAFVACAATLVSGSTGTAYHPIGSALYRQVWEPFLTIQITVGDATVRRGSGFLVAHTTDALCRVYAITNHHVIFGEEALLSDTDNVPDLGDTVITVKLAHKIGEKNQRVHLAELIRTSKSADVSMLLVPHLSCDTTRTAYVAPDNRNTMLRDEVLHIVAAGAEPANTEIRSGEVTRFSVDPMGDITLGTSVPIYSGMSGSPVFRRHLWRYEVIGIAKSHSVAETPEGVTYPTGTNYVVPIEILHIVLNH